MIHTIGLSLLVASAAALPAPRVPIDERMIEVAQGRSLYLRCVGSGPVTVLFDAGGSDWSVIWAGIQERIGPKARACAYDRAGMGKSDPAPGPRTPAAIAADIHALIGRAGSNGPVVLVGHSLGGFNVKLAAALFPEDVAGLVLIDPAEDRTWERTRDQLGAQYGVQYSAQAELLDRSFFPALVEKYQTCAKMAASTRFVPGTPEYRKCADPDRPALGESANAERQRVHVTVAYQEAQASEIRWCVYADPSNDPVYAQLFKPGALGSKPVVVLTHRDPPSDDAIDKLNAEQGLLLHRETAALSSRGAHEFVDGSGHYIQLDRPEVVSKAIERVIKEVLK